ncbi:MAG TPA: hypothetical protein VEN82_05395 [Actinomycetota bacterium]|nr:hypothetical protein [Actinomycetota bacterium]
MRRTPFGGSSPNACPAGCRAVPRRDVGDGAAHHAFQLLLLRRGELPGERDAGELWRDGPAGRGQDQGLPLRVPLDHVLHPADERGVGHRRVDVDEGEHRRVGDVGHERQRERRVARAVPRIEPVPGQAFRGVPDPDRKAELAGGTAKQPQEPLLVLLLDEQQRMT